MDKVIDFPLNEKLLKDVQNEINSTMNLIELILNDKKEKYEYYEVTSEGREKHYQDREHYLEDSMDHIWQCLENVTDDLRHRTGISADEKFENGAIME